MKSFDSMIKFESQERSSSEIQVKGLACEVIFTIGVFLGVGGRRIDFPDSRIHDWQQDLHKQGLSPESHLNLQQQYEQ